MQWITILQNIVKEFEAVPPVDFAGLPDITLRQLEVFKAIFDERSYANAALELRTTRTNLKRVSDEFARAFGDPLFEEAPGKSLEATPFAHGVASQMTPLSRTLRRLHEGVRSLHEGGRLLRLAAGADFFGEGIFSSFLTRLKVKDLFRPCFLKIGPARYRTALLNAECDVYFGGGITGSDRLDQVDLGPVPWRVSRAGGGGEPFTGSVTDLPAGRWGIAAWGEPESSIAVLEAFHAAGAEGGEIVRLPSERGFLMLEPDVSGSASAVFTGPWPAYRFSAVLRKHHPYSELKGRLTRAASC